MTQDYNSYKPEDFSVWKTLFDRQSNNLQEKASHDYIRCLNLMHPVLNGEEIPSFNKINNWFKEHTGWQIECVPGLIDVDKFFVLLSQKKFPSSTWLRSLDKLDYLEEPDMFHDIFGHVPLLASENYSNFINKFGSLGIKYHSDKSKLIALQRLYWFTIEFGLCIENGSHKIYGAGIISSFGESNKCLNLNQNYVEFDLMEVIKHDFCTSEMQDTYYILNQVDSLYDEILRLESFWDSKKIFNF